MRGCVICCEWSQLVMHCRKFQNRFLALFVSTGILKFIRGGIGRVRPLRPACLIGSGNFFGQDLNSSVLICCEGERDREGERERMPVGPSTCREAHRA